MAEHSCGNLSPLTECASVPVGGTPGDSSACMSCRGMRSGSVRGGTAFSVRLGCHRWRWCRWTVGRGSHAAREDSGLGVQGGGVKPGKRRTGFSTCKALGPGPEQDCRAGRRLVPVAAGPEEWPRGAQTNGPRSGHMERGRHELPQPWGRGSLSHPPSPLTVPGAEPAQ